MSLFMAYAKHEQEKEDLVNRIVEEAKNGNTQFSIELDDSFSEAEIQEIENEIYRRLN